MNINKYTAIAAFVGITHAAIVLYILFVALSVSYIGDNPLAAMIGNVVRIILLFLIGSAPIYLVLRYGLVLPLLVPLFTTWSSIRDHVVGFRMEPFTTFYFNTFTLSVTITIVTAIAVIEFGFRDWLSVFPPEPLI